MCLKTVLFILNSPKYNSNQEWILQFEEIWEKGWFLFYINEINI